MEKRLNKFIAETGHCSRREADEIIEAARVTVNGKPAELGMKVSPEDEIRIDGKLIIEKTTDFVYLALNKPVGIECTTNTDVKDNIIDFLHYPKRIFPIGRLDKASEGLIFLTDDGDIVNKILRARNNHEKEYVVTVNQPVSDRFIQKMGAGVPILGTVTRECKVWQTGAKEFRIILTQGLNRQIRRMCEYLGYEVETLKRVRIINISLDLPTGRHRELNPEEIEQLKTLVESSDKTEDASLPQFRTQRKSHFEAPKRDFSRSDFPKKKPSGDGPKRDFPKKDFSDKPKRDFKRSDFSSDKPTSDRPKKEFSDKPKRDFKRSDFSSDKPASDRPKKEFSEKPKRDFKRSDFPTDKSSDKKTDAPKRRVEFIKKDDPDYKKKGDY